MEKSQELQFGRVRLKIEELGTGELTDNRIVSITVFNDSDDPLYLRSLSVPDVSGLDHITRESSKFETASELQRSITEFANVISDDLLSRRAETIRNVGAEIVTYIDDVSGGKIKSPFDVFQNVKMFLFRPVYTAAIRNRFEEKLKQHRIMFASLADAEAYWRENKEAFEYSPAFKLTVESKLNYMKSLSDRLSAQEADAVLIDGRSNYNESFTLRISKHPFYPKSHLVPFEFIAVAPDQSEEQRGKATQIVTMSPSVIALSAISAFSGAVGIMLNVRLFGPPESGDALVVRGDDVLSAAFFGAILAIIVFSLFERFSWSQILKIPLNLQTAITVGFCTGFFYLNIIDWLKSFPL